MEQAVCHHQSMPLIQAPPAFGIAWSMVNRTSRCIVVRGNVVTVGPIFVGKSVEQQKNVLPPC